MLLLLCLVLLFLHLQLLQILAWWKYSVQFSTAQCLVGFLVSKLNFIMIYYFYYFFFTAIVFFIVPTKEKRSRSSDSSSGSSGQTGVSEKRGKLWALKKRVGGVSYVVLGSTKNLQRQLFMIITISCCCCCQCCCCCCNSWYCFGSWCSRCQESVCACVLAKLTSTVILCFVFKKSLQNTQMPFPLLPLLFNSNNRNKTDFINLKNVKKILK